MQIKINQADLLGCVIILASLALIPSSTFYWLTYAAGCYVYAVLFYQKKLYFGIFMNVVAIIIAITNFIKG